MTPLSVAAQKGSAEIMALFFKKCKFTPGVFDDIIVCILCFALVITSAREPTPVIFLLF